MVDAVSLVKVGGYLIQGFLYELVEEGGSLCVMLYTRVVTFLRCGQSRDEEKYESYDDDAKSTLQLWG